MNALPALLTPALTLPLMVPFAHPLVTLTSFRSASVFGLSAPVRDGTDPLSRGQARPNAAARESHLDRGWSP